MQHETVYTRSRLLKIQFLPQNTGFSLRFDETSSTIYKSNIKLNISRNKHKKRPFYIINFRISQYLYEWLSRDQCRLAGDHDRMIGIFRNQVELEKQRIVKCSTSAVNFGSGHSQNIASMLSIR